MKKLLALVLAMVMTLGLATVGANAAFADAASIEHKEAVEVLNSLGVIGGKENNNFDPTGNVKRSEMAKMITLIMLGDVDVSAFTGAATDLTDINGHWAEGYIKYCVSQGIVGGRGNGKFDPDANVTAAEAAKMLLVAIGYNANVQGYTGNQWTINVTRDAQLSDFYTKLSNLSSNKALTRDEAAQMIYNAADAPLIVATPTFTVGTTEVQYQYSKTTDTNGDGNIDDLLEKTYKITRREGILDDFTAATDYDSFKKEYTWTITLNAASALAEGAATKRITTTTDYSDLYMNDVKALYKVVDGKTTLYGIYATDDNAVIAQSTLADISLVTGETGQIKVGSTVYTLDNTTATNSTVITNLAGTNIGVSGRLDEFTGVALTDIRATECQMCNRSCCTHTPLSAQKGGKTRGTARYLPDRFPWQAPVRHRLRRKALREPRRAFDCPR